MANNLVGVLYSSVRVAFRWRGVDVLWGRVGSLLHILNLWGGGILLGGILLWGGILVGTSMHVLYLWGGGILDLGGSVLDLLGAGGYVLGLGWGGGVLDLGGGVGGGWLGGVSLTDDLGEETQVGVSYMGVAEVEAGYLAGGRVVWGHWSGNLGGISRWGGLICYTSWGTVLDLKRNIKLVYLLTL